MFFAKMKKKKTCWSKFKFSMKSVLDLRSLIANSSVAHMSIFIAGIVCCRTQLCDTAAANHDIHGKNQHC